MPVKPPPPAQPPTETGWAPNLYTAKLPFKRKSIDETCPTLKNPEKTASHEPFCKNRSREDFLTESGAALAKELPVNTDSVQLLD